ncbi:helix-turn-helix transcriptional regulator [Nocardia sp. 2]|uniref:Helix-turn-helix transcriptional regulator n=1 Tax=Nocardia acididurans TaxID=2802282 RepID=A0ABS1MBB5_9NOCA|nr:DUF5919 domain-containing protein [Nocardia acididurans]MBL1077938.1 helix-turn-helix transcriptional regulator [Nocardia acididurans]
MANERLRSALLHNGLTPQTVAGSLDVDAKTVERWITKARVPYPKHRYALAALLHESEEYLWPEVAPQRQYADVAAVFATRADFNQAMPPRELFRDVGTIDLAGLSLNLLCQQHSDREILKLVAAGCTFRCLFLDPAGVHVVAREKEEGHGPGVLSGLTRINIDSLIRLTNQIPSNSSGSIVIRIYDEPIRFNITVIDRKTCIVQPYLPNARGVDSPTFVARRSDQPGLFDTFVQVFEALWVSGREVGAQ